MRKIFFSYSTGFCGSDGHEVVEYSDDITDAQLDEDAWQGALNNAEMYGYYPTGYAPDDYDEEEDSYAGDQYTDNIGGEWEEYSEEKHSGYL